MPAKVGIHAFAWTNKGVDGRTAPAMTVKATVPKVSINGRWY